MDQGETVVQEGVLGESIVFGGPLMFALAISGDLGVD